MGHLGDKLHSSPPLSPVTYESVIFSVRFYQRSAERVQHAHRCPYRGKRRIVFSVVTRAALRRGIASLGNYKRTHTSSSSPGLLLPKSHRPCLFCVKVDQFDRLNATNLPIS